MESLLNGFTVFVEFDVLDISGEPWRSPLRLAAAASFDGRRKGKGVIEGGLLRNRRSDGKENFETPKSARKYSISKLGLGAIDEVRVICIAIFLDVAILIELRHTRSREQPQD